jgi:2-phospho-L-lactate guanylyltransferase
VVIPVKRLAYAKTRLAWPPAWRADLAEAMALDVADAVRRTPAVAGAVVVSSDPRIRADMAARELVVVDDPGHGLGAAIRAGVDHWRRHDPDVAVAILTADLPCLSPQLLDAALAGAGRWPAAFVPDRAGTGTTLLAATQRAQLRPRFGPGSAAAHRGTGAVPIGEELSGLRLDVDSLDDLALVTRAPWSASLGANTAATLADRARQIGQARLG